MNTILTWPDKPTCHQQASAFKHHDMGLHWRPHRLNDPDSPYDYPFRTCSYCGSIHPEDLLKLANENVAVLTGSDWKYGWPHKFYVDNIPNPANGQMRCSGGFGGGAGQELEELKKKYPDLTNWRGNVRVGWEADRMSKAPPHTHAKWYNEHLLELNPDAFAAMTSMLLTKTGIAFKLKGDRLAYVAPLQH